MSNLNRRQFIKSGSGLAAAITLGSGSASLLSKSLKKTNSIKMIGIQIGAPSFVDEGIEGCLDTLQERACVNTLFAMVYSYKEGLSGRAWPPVDHGRQQPRPKFHGGYYATLHPKYYRETLFKDNIQVVRAPDEGDFDLLASVIPAARKRGIKTVPFLADQIHENIPQFGQMAEWDLYGRKLSQVCFNNPHFCSYLLAMVEDCVRSYEIDGLLWRSERWGALSNALSLSRGAGTVKNTEIACFCPYCLEKGKKQGINVERARKGYLVLEDYVAAARAGRRPIDGYYVTFWRILLRYPEILAWDMFWYDSLREIYKTVYAKAKSIKPELPIGWALPHTISFNPFYRAIADLRELAKYSDFVKIIAYHSDGGPRCAKYVDALHSTYLQDLSRDEALAFEYRIMGFSEGGYDEIRAKGLSSDYVYRETKAWVAGAMGTTLQIWPGIDIDVSPGENGPPRSREGVRDAVLAAFRANAPGVILARMYSEMTLDHLSGAGDAIRQLGFV